ncbi:MAG TPA: sugar porter family MFS transporter [Gemmatimonadota bacterium]|nr:sugar porter family MFS transporter [Gemmatimonadota bacterium]
MALHPALRRSVVAAALGGLLFGFDTAVISGTTEGLRRSFQLTPGALGLTVSIALWGTVLGALVAAYPADRFGRRDSLRVCGVLFLISAVGCAVAWGWTSLMVSRFLGGLAIGGVSVLVPMYIAEISPSRLRGRLVGVFQINIVVGILVAYFSNYLIGGFGLGDGEWRWKFGVEAVPAVLFLVLLLDIPLSPRWLVKTGRIEDARRVLARIGDVSPETSLEEMLTAVELERRHGQERLLAARNRFPLFLAISIAAFNQLSGINAILYYLNDIFAYAGFDKVSSDLQAVAIGFTNLVFTLLAMSIIDRVGRRTLLIVGSIGTAASLAGVAAVFWTGSREDLLLWLLIAFIASFAFSQGAVIWVYLAEVFPTAVRAKGQSLGSSVHWVMNALISWGFPIVAASSRAIPFAFFAGMMLVQLFIVMAVYPETKGVTLEEMESRLATR